MATGDFAGKAGMHSDPRARRPAGTIRARRSFFYVRTEGVTMNKIPVTVITGFLGAGKTTLVRHLLSHAKGKRIALIINEFGDLGVDREVIAAGGHDSCREEGMIELLNGCICCTGGGDFHPTMETLLGRDDKPDHIVIETSGLALPQPLIRAF